MLLPKGSDVVMQMHYHRNGKPEKDRTKIGLYFAKKPVERAHARAGGARSFKIEKASDGLGFIPAGERELRGSRVVVRAAKTAPSHMVMPHMHLLGKSVKMTMTPPEGEDRGARGHPGVGLQLAGDVLSSRSRSKVKAGTRFEIEAVFDNSAANPNNPHDPPSDVRFGEQTTDEMLFGMFGATKDNPKNGLPLVITQGPFRLRSGRVSSVAGLSEAGATRGE